MRSEPTGRYVVKYKDKALAAKTFHLYTDCGYMQSLMAEGLDPSVIEPSDEIVSILEMRVCSGCEARSLEVPAEDVIAEVLGCSPVDASKVLTALYHNGYVIKHVKQRRGAAKQVV